MASAFLRLLALVALVMMPVGMGAAPAAAAKADHAMMAGEDHCAPQQQEDGKAPPQAMDCTAACSALPPVAMPVPGRSLRPATPRALLAARTFEQKIPEIATPPPRHG